MWGISIFADFRSIAGISLHAMVVFGLGKDLLFKSVLENCAKVPLSSFMFIKQIFVNCLIMSIILSII